MLISAIRIDTILDLLCSSREPSRNKHLGHHFECCTICSFRFIAKLLYPHEPIRRILVAALALSLVIEVSQYVLNRGVTQFDDVMHNLIGASVGYGISVLLHRIYKQYNIKQQ